jgi:predicted acyltransferase (DUF342 family)
MAFLVFTLLFLLLFYMHFALAHRAWLTIRGRQSSELDMGYVRLEDYFGQSFRAKLREWTKSVTPDPSSTASLKVLHRGAERIFIAGPTHYPAGRKESEVLVIEGDFVCGNECAFDRELMVKGNCGIGADSQLQAVAVDGSLHLGSGTTVRRWVDATRHMTLGEHTLVQSRATSRASIEFLPGARALSLFAPEIFTEGRHEAPLRLAVNPAGVVQIPHAAGARAEHGYDPAKIFAMGGGTYLYDGDLVVTAPLHITSALVVRGRLDCGRENLIEADIKAHGDVRIGAASVLKGNVVSGGNMVLEPNTYFQGLLHAGGSMRLARGVRGLREDTPVAVYAAGVVTVESNVVVNGKLASATQVRAVSTPLAWLEGTK